MASNSKAPLSVEIDGIKKSISDLRVVDLRSELEKYELPKNGTKPVLVARLTAHLMTLLPAEKEKKTEEENENEKENEKQTEEGEKEKKIEKETPEEKEDSVCDESKMKDNTNDVELKQDVRVRRKIKREEQVESNTEYIVREENDDEKEKEFKSEKSSELPTRTPSLKERLEEKKDIDVSLNSSVEKPRTTESENINELTKKENPLTESKFKRKSQNEDTQNESPKKKNQKEETTKEEKESQNIDQDLRYKDQREKTSPKNPDIQSRKSHKENISNKQLEFQSTNKEDHKTIKDENSGKKDENKSKESQKAEQDSIKQIEKAEQDSIKQIEILERENVNFLKEETNVKKIEMTNDKEDPKIQKEPTLPKKLKIESGKPHKDENRAEMNTRESGKPHKDEKSPLKNENATKERRQTHRDEKSPLKNENTTKERRQTPKEEISRPKNENTTKVSQQIIKDENSSKHKERKHERKSSATYSVSHQKSLIKSRHQINSSKVENGESKEKADEVDHDMTDVIETEIREASSESEESEVVETKIIQFRKLNSFSSSSSERKKREWGSHRSESDSQIFPELKSVLESNVNEDLLNKTTTTTTIEEPTSKKIKILDKSDKISIRENETEYLYIRNLVRPFTVNQLKDLLKRTGTLEGFWIDKIKSHCIVKFSKMDEASETKQALDGVKWPNSNPKTLSVSFTTQEKFERLNKDFETKETTLAPTSTPTSTPHPHQSLNNGEKKKVKLLDDLFRKTKASPSIYWCEKAQ